ncbi:Mobile element protein [hydrothermal vent metagenome]|uniref:Mobile element protein n=1 Tax=hydrothermal vent metagenome TaxID=652676 RepID=A0A3B1DDD1_9ZZZZ
MLYDHQRNRIRCSNSSVAEHPYSVYDFTPTRQRADPETFLKNFQGYLQADAYAGYEELYRTQEIQQVSCWAHARRTFFEAKTVQPMLAHRALLFIKNLYNVERQAKVEKSELQDSTMRQKLYADRFELRQEKSLPILNEFYDWLKATVGSLLPKSPVAGAIGYLLNRWDSFTRYCSEGMLAIDNNLTERTMRPCASEPEIIAYLKQHGAKTAEELKAGQSPTKEKVSKKKKCSPRKEVIDCSVANTKQR